MHVPAPNLTVTGFKPSTRWIGGIPREGTGALDPSVYNAYVAAGLTPQAAMVAAQRASDEKAATAATAAKGTDWGGIFKDAVGGLTSTYATIAAQQEATARRRFERQMMLAQPGYSPPATPAQTTLPLQLTSPTTQVSQPMMVAGPEAKKTAGWVMPAIVAGVAFVAAKVFKLI